MKESLGICLGASTISMVHMRRTSQGDTVVGKYTRSHEGNARKTLTGMLQQLGDLSRMRIAATGRKFRHHVSLSTLSEPEAVELAIGYLLPENHPYRVVISAGGETFMIYHLDDDGKIQGIYTGNKCASGTGEFFLQQIGRMGIPLAEITKMGVPDKIHKVSGRCSVFCKSDCTHAMNKGVPKSQVVAGLTRMMSNKAMELAKKLPKQSVILTGGCALNQGMVHFIRQEVDDLFIPEEAPYFEALGAALWALENETRAWPGQEKLFVERASLFSFLKPLADYRHLVHFKTHPRSSACEGDQTILGLDVGSTTTKGVIMRRSDKAILAADYLRTNGDPIDASRRVYRSLADQITVPVEIQALGVTGSGRQISGLHAMTAGVINEIIAHATAAIHFDPEVDTIFEIGGQDAKYTYITNSVPSDYAMNEACSAGTGSFLEESAKESLGLKVTEIGDVAYRGSRPPNFNDQCAAFIGSDIKGAVQEGVPMDDIVAGLVYSICMNYTNRVKGNRPMGKKIFIQGGVCYNEAVPAAMAALTGKEMIVPPEPGLMGAFGVALEVERRMEQGMVEPGRFDLNKLAERDVIYGKPFQCGGGKEKCDRRCEIARIEIDGKTYPFGGICNRYDNIIHKRKINTADLNLVVNRQKRVFRDLVLDSEDDHRPTVGMNRSFLVNTYFPFYNRFFAELGYRLILPEKIDPHGVDRKGSAFCFPVEIAHGHISNLLARQPDFIFLPHLSGLPTDSEGPSCTCVLVQGEPFYLRSAFPDLENSPVLSPTLDFSQGIQAETNIKALQKVAKRLGADRKTAKSALSAAVAEQDAFYRDIREQGMQVLDWLANDPDRMAVVVFGRPYSAFAPEANKGIPVKFASRGVCTIPFDMLPYETKELDQEMNMYWGMGQMLLRAAEYVKSHPQTFATWITNFSCGPDSFLVGYFRDIMKRKPSLTLELDSHTADAGLETRIEAFLDIVNYYRHIAKHGGIPRVEKQFKPAAIEYRDGKAGIVVSDGSWLSLQDKRVKVVVPAMGRFGHPLLTRSFARVGVQAVALPPADEEILKLGRGNSSCKECLPLQTTVGSMLHYLKNIRPAGECTVYFMPSAVGPCRFGQYNVFSKRVIEKHRIPDAAVISPNCINGYGGLGDKFSLAAWRAIIIGDLFDEMWSTILTAAKDRQGGLDILNSEYQAILEAVDKDWLKLAGQLAASAKNLSGIELNRPFDEIPKISLIGEIYVRHDPISLQQLIERMADRGFIVRTAQTSEWIHYTDWLISKGIEGKPSLSHWMRRTVKRYFDRKVRRLLAPSGLFFYEEMDVAKVIETGSEFISPKLTGEAILTVGAAFHEILHPSCGIISIGPFGCMPSRVAEAILSEKLTTKVKKRLTLKNGHSLGSLLDTTLGSDRKFPFLAIETDGSPFPQVIEARLEAFCLQAERLHDLLVAA